MILYTLPSGRWLKSEVSSIRLLLYSPSGQLGKLPTKNCNQRLLLCSLRTGALVTLRKPNNPKTFKRGALTTHLVPCFLPRKKKSPNRRRGVTLITKYYSYLRPGLLVPLAFCAKF